MPREQVFAHLKAMVDRVAADPESDYEAYRRLAELLEMADADEFLPELIASARKSDDVDIIEFVSDASVPKLSAAKVFKEIDGLLPLVVRKVSVNESFLGISGADWGLSVSCPWALFNAQGQPDGFADLAEDTSKLLSGRVLQHISRSGDVIKPVFHFGAGLSLQVLPDDDFYTWTLSVPGYVVTGNVLRTWVHIRDKT
ncbi:MAG: hypothetical protein LBU38_00110 [Propionibacteriaceae bacterium]|jgi:hypothetical protein|nr:hypothetical protein [Propionibacteriaceae bacterium]